MHTGFGWCARQTIGAPPHRGAFIRTVPAWGLLLCVRLQMKKLATRLLLSACVAAGLPTAWQPAWAADAIVTFDALEFVIEGNTVLPPEQVERVVQPYLGPGKTFKDMEAARAALEKAYQDAGYLSVVVSLPNQRIVGGEVRFEITEAKVDKLKITGAQYNLPSQIAGQVPSLAKGQVPYFPQMQDELAATQRADLQLTPLIGPGDEPDQINVELKVEDKPALRGSLEVNSKQSFNSLRGRTEALVAYNNLFQRGHSLALAWQYAPRRPSDANTLTAAYAFPLNRADKVLLALTNSNSDTPTGTSLGGATLSRGQFLSARWRRQLDAAFWPASHSLTAGLDYKNNRDSSRTASGLTTEKPALRYPVINLGYELNWQGAQGSTTGLRSSLAGTSRQLAERQVDCEGVQLDQFDCKRFGARADFLVWKFGLEHERDVIAGWRLSARADAQLASGPLTSAEQYGLGGMDTVRGYYDYEQTGDQGWNTQLALLTPNWLPGSDWRLKGLFFYDRGFVLLQQPLSGQIARVHLGSLGLGWRLDSGKGLKLSADVARPLFHTRRAADSGQYQAATDQKLRWELRLSYEF